MQIRLSILAILGLAGCRDYDLYGALASQDGLVPATRFARYGTEQASAVAVGRSLAAWRMTGQPDDLERQSRQVSCFALRLPEVKQLEPDPPGHRIAVIFHSSWRAGVIPIPDGVEPSGTPGIGSLLPVPSGCR